MDSVTTEEMKKTSSESPPPTSFSSLPYDVTLNLLSRISRMHRPTVSLVSKSFRSLIASRELQVTRTLIRKTENYMYLCIKFREYPKHRWFLLAPTPKQQKLIPMPLFPCVYPESPTIVSVGSEIYLIGGFVNNERRRKVFLLDCESRQWCTLPEMSVPRGEAIADVIDGKLYVIGGCKSNKREQWGEIYDPKTQTWERLSSPTTLDLTTQESVIPGCSVLGGKVYTKNGLKFNFREDICLVEIENNMFCQISASNGKLYWRDANEYLEWTRVTGLGGLGPFVSVANSGGGRNVTVWWITEIWCSEISFESRGIEELGGVVEWSKSVFTYAGYLFGSFVLHSAIVTH